MTAGVGKALGWVEGPLVGEIVGLLLRAIPEVGEVEGRLLGRLVSTAVEGLFVDMLGVLERALGLRVEELTVGTIDGLVVAATGGDEGALLLVTVGDTVGDIVVATLGIGVIKTDGTGVSPSALHAHLP